MQTIIITLDPEKLDDPDLDLRYSLPEQLEQLTHGGFLDFHTLAMHSFQDHTGDAVPLITPVRHVQPWSKS